MNNRRGQISKYFKKWNTEIKKAHGIEHRCLSKTERKKIKKVVEETGYVPSKKLQSQIQGNRPTIGVIIPKINSESISRMI